VTNDEIIEILGIWGHTVMCYPHDDGSVSLSFAIEGYHCAAENAPKYSCLEEGLAMAYHKIYWNVAGFMMDWDMLTR
jgi:hypothetical protein